MRQGSRTETFGARDSEDIADPSLCGPTLQGTPRRLGPSVSSAVAATAGRLAALDFIAWVADWPGFPKPGRVGFNTGLGL